MHKEIGEFRPRALGRASDVGYSLACSEWCPTPNSHHPAPSLCSPPGKHMRATPRSPRKCIFYPMLVSCASLGGLMLCAVSYTSEVSALPPHGKTAPGAPALLSLVAAAAVVAALMFPAPIRLSHPCGRCRGSLSFRYRQINGAVAVVLTGLALTDLPPRPPLVDLVPGAGVLLTPTSVAGSADALQVLCYFLPAPTSAAALAYVRHHRPRQIRGPPTTGDHSK